MKLGSIAVRSVVGLACLLGASVASADWEEVLGGEGTGCALPDGALGIGTPFKYYADIKSRDDDLLIYFAGGGACWDAETCSDSLFGESTYLAFVPEGIDDGLNSMDPDVQKGNGILSNLADNPYAGYSKVLIPYCTGDVHIGQRIVPYDGQVVDIPIQHLGYNNFLDVLEWITMRNLAPGKITVAGSSGGGYGALLNFPKVRDELGEHIKYSIIVDAANGVLTEGFFDDAVRMGGAWNAKIDSLFADAINLPADNVWPAAISAVAQTYRDTRVSQSTTAYDGVQAAVLLTAKKVDDGTYDPFAPRNELEIALTALLEWSPKARTAMVNTAFSNILNYRYYLGEGSGHIHLVDPPEEFTPTTPNYFEENSARRVDFTDWLGDMLNKRRLFFRTDWRNLSCFPGCLQ